MIEEKLVNILHCLDTCRDRKIADLEEAVAIRSVSGSLKYANEILKTIRWVEMWIKKTKGHHECHDIGKYELNGKTVELPWVILAKFGNDPKKKTLCVYCHYDVADAGNNWVTDPWKLQNRQRRLYGRGALKGKGALLSWFHCIEAFQKLNIPLPINLKFIIEGMFESGSIGLENFLYSQRLLFLRNIDYVTLCESEWLTEKVPCIVFGTVGICIYDIMCSSSNGKEIMEFITSNLVDKNGNILIQNLNTDVLNVNPLIEQTMENVQLDLDELKKKLPDYMQSWGKRKILMRLWRQPSLTCTRIEEDKSKDVKCRLVLKLVSALTPERCRQFIWDRIKCLVCDKFGKRNEVVTTVSKNGLKLMIEIGKGGKGQNKITCHNRGSSRPWQEDLASKHYYAARDAIRTVYKQEPNFIRDLGEIPVVNILKGLNLKNIMLLPLGNNEMDEHRANECITLRSFSEAKKMLAAYLFELAKI